MAKIAIDAGHGLYTAGKRCLKSLDPNETREWVLNDRIADALGTYLKSAGHTILRVDDEDGSSDISLPNRVARANKWGADAYVSVHHNAAICGGSGGGTVVYVAKSCSAKSIQMQNAVYKHTINRGNLKGNRSDGTLANNFYVIRHTKMPAILIEAGFMDSSTDIKYILDPEWSKKMGLGIAEGVCEVFGGKVNAGTTVTTKPTVTLPNASTIKKDGDIEVDGYWGKNTTIKLQKVFKKMGYNITVDGIISNQWLCYADENPGLEDATFDWDKKPNGKGSQLIKAMQKWAGMAAKDCDGEIGTNTIKAFQKKLGCAIVDGEVSAPSNMVKALQRWANAQD